MTRVLFLLRLTSHTHHTGLRRPVRATPRSSHCAARVYSRRSSDSGVAHTRTSSLLYTHLETQLRLSPITPNEALELLVDPFPAVHHCGVLEHLVCVVHDNACCLDPSACLLFMSTMLHPTAPRCLHGSVVYDDDEVEESGAEKSGCGCLHTASEFSNLSVQVILDTLATTLIRCAIAELQRQLQNDASPSLWQSAMSSVQLTSKNSEGEGGSPTSPNSLLGGAAVLLAFVMKHAVTRRGDGAAQGRLTGANSRCVSQCSSLVRAVVQRFQNSTEETGRVSPRAETLTLDVLQPNGFAHTAPALHHARWRRRFFSSARRCWHWSILVCRATPLLLSRPLRSCAVSSLTEALESLHACLLSHQRTLPPATCAEAVEVLCWLLTRSLPMLRILSNNQIDGAGALSERDGGAVQPLWTTRLHEILTTLAGDFAALAADALQTHACDSAVRSEVVSMVTAVAFRLSLQSAAAEGEGGDRTARVPTSSQSRLVKSEVEVVRRLLRCALGCDICIAAQGISPADCNADHRVQSVVWVTEETWCRLVSIQHFLLLQGSLEGHAAEVQANVSAKCVVAYDKFLRVAVDHLVRRSTPAATHSDSRSPSGDPSSAHAAQHSVSLGFVFVFVKCWRAWRAACPDCSAGAGWLHSLRERIPRGTPSSADVGSNSHAEKSASSPPSPHQLTLWLVEAWAAALGGDEDIGALNVCACWSGLSVTPHLSCTSSADMDQALTSCEQRLAHQCGEFVLWHKNRYFRSASGGASLHFGALRPRLSYPASAALRLRLHHHQQQQHAITEWDARVRRSEVMWSALSLPAVLSHVGLRLMRPAVAALPLYACEERSLDTASPLHLPVSDAVLAVVRRSIETPLPLEVAHFSLYFVTTFVTWCEAAGVHEGWSCISVVDCTGNVDEDCSMQARCAEGCCPWLLLSVEGLASASGLHGASDTVALAFLWSKGKCQSCTDAAVGGRVSSAVSPLTHTAVRKAQNVPPQLSRRAVAADYGWLRLALAQWTRRYALLLVLFLTADDEWQRSRAAHARRRTATTLLLQSGTCPRPQWNWGADRGCSRRVPAAPSATLQSGADSPLSLTSTTRRSSNSEVWECEAQLRLQLYCVARRLRRHVEQLSHAMQQSSSLTSADATVAVRDTQRDLAALLGQLTEAPHTSSSRATATTLSWLRSCTKRFLLRLSDDDGKCVFRGEHRQQEHSPSGQQSVCRRVQASAAPREYRVQELETTLHHLRLVSLDTSGEAREAKAEATGGDNRTPQDVCDSDEERWREEAWAVLAALCRSPDLSFLTSPTVLRFVEKQWSDCWRCLLCGMETASHSAAAAVAADNGSCWWEHVAAVADVVAQLDALVTYRLMLRATHAFHLLAAELMEYVAVVYMPVLRAAAAPTCGFVTTAVEALERQLTERDCVGGKVHGFRFSSASLRTYEVLLCNRYGAEERREPCVWQRWMQELACEDAVLQQSPLRARSV